MIPKVGTGFRIRSCLSKEIRKLFNVSDGSIAGLAAAEDSGRAVFGRRVFFAVLVLLTIFALLALAGYALSAGGFGFADGVLLLLFGLTMPWSVIGFWNATIGFFVMRFARDPVAAVNPSAARVRNDEPITASTAITIFVRNEPPDRVIRNLDAMMRELAASGYADKFHLYVLSDTGLPDIAALEEKGFAALKAEWQGRMPVTYRRREINTGFKAGNFWDFCQRWGDDHEFAVTLDTDSFMTAAAIMRMVRIMQADPKLGILQGLVVGLPSTSAFARIFQFGMRLGMRSWTIGSAWWQADCGPYWGHNAALRIAPFKTYCEIPELPGKGVLRGHVLSHDQIEAALMRRGGYDVRVLPEEDLGWEENPPTLIEFIRRDQRWCQGTLQYGFFLFKPGLKFVGRFQLAFAMLMFLGSPAWIGLLVVGTLAIATSPSTEAFIRADAGYTLLAVVLVMWFAPKIATVIDVLTRPELRRAFGGTLRFLASVVTETCFFILLSPIMWFCHTLFLAGLPFGKVIGWIGQVRDDHTVPWPVAAKQLWPHMTLGWICLAILAATHPVAAVYAFLLIAGGLAVSVPLAVVTAIPRVGHALARIGIGRLPEETAPPRALAALSLPALAAAARTV
ncbi:MAG: glucans biosynthesis glucosyltransferase MdoH [Alphaproteobacteria bacterium]|nr:glucans biosynthesis glucosyltransferase MdoH [Alphaproteobacteria bacterium]